jgi:diguanylate cyclase (GGDEF)-like protein/PAS domain S-box-containing protein
MNSWWSQERYSVSKINAYFITIMLVALFSIIRIWPLHMLGSYNPYLTYYPAIIIAAVIGGFFTGLLATTMTCLIVSCFWWLLVNEPFIKVLSDWLAMTLFVFSGILISSIAESMRRANERAQSERKQLEFSLSKMNALLEATPDCLIISNKEGYIIFVNVVAEKIFGYTTEELIRQRIEFLLPARYKKHHVKKRQHYFEKPKLRPMGQEQELFGQHKDGHEFPVEISLSPIETEEGLLVLATVRDITERKQAENALKMSELRFRTMAEAMPQVVWITRPDGWNIYFNQQWVDYTGLTLEESYGNGWNKPFHPDDQRRAWDAWQQAIHNNGKYSLECRLRRKDGVYRWWLVRGVPLHDESGNIMQWFGTCTDINDIKAVEQDLRIAAATFETYEAIMITDADASIIKVNKAFTRITGFCPEDVLGKNPRIMKSGRHDKSFYVEMFLKLQRDGVWEGEIWDKRKNDEIYPISMVITVIKDAQQKIVQYVSIFRDITERKKTEDAKAMLSALVESSDEAIIGKDLQGIIFSWNKSAEELYGYTEAEMKGSSIKKLFPNDKQDEFDIIIDMIKRGEHIKHKETVRIHKDGHMIPVSVTISPINNTQGQVIGASTTARDITQQKLFEEKLKHLAEHDPLTGLINRPLFEDRIEQAILLSKRQKDTMAVCFLDIDNFKHINDQYGHATGDLLLCAATKRLQTCIRECDTLARLGGDEFALILLNIKKEQDVIKVAKKMIQRFSEEFLIENKTLKVTLSIGISLYPRDGHKSLIEKADSAMYYVKNHGKNNFKLFDTSLQFGRK